MLLRHRFALLALAIAVGLFLAMLLFVEVGRQFGVTQAANRGPEARAGVGVVDGAVYGLLALLVGFMFSRAAGRFDHRRELIADEASAIGTAWQRVDLLPVESQAAIRDGLRRYVDTLLAWYEEAPGSSEPAREPRAVTHAQN